jgi:hypothetical protein
MYPMMETVTTRIFVQTMPVSQQVVHIPLIARMIRAAMPFRNAAVRVTMTALTTAIPAPTNPVTSTRVIANRSSIPLLVMTASSVLWKIPAMAKGSAWVQKTRAVTRWVVPMIPVMKGMILV